MGKFRALLLLNGLLFCGLGSGCGTVTNLVNEPSVYGGTRLDISWIRDSSRTDTVILGVVDLPLSLVGDTLLLPLTFPLQYFRTHKQSLK